MIIRYNIPKETATRSSLHNRGYERSEHPRQVNSPAVVHSGGVPQPQRGDPTRVGADAIPHPGVLRTPRLRSDDKDNEPQQQQAVIIAGLSLLTTICAKKNK